MESTTPSSVFHYTTADGLFHIVDKHQFRMTSADGVNDSEEIKTGRDYVNRFLRLNQEKFGMDAIHEWMEEDGDPTSHTYLFCASAERDDASQWERYADYGRGYAIEIDITGSFDLAVLSREEPTDEETDIFRFFHDSQAQVDQWTKTLYSNTERQAVLERAMHKWGNILEEHDSQRPRADTETYTAWETEWSSLNFECWLDFISIANSIKHPGFRAENEYRIVASAQVPTGSYASFRTSPYGIVSSVYLVAKGDYESFGGVVSIPETSPLAPLPIKRVIVGPKHSSDQTVRLRSFLDSRGYREVEVDRSEVPLR